ncbi:acyl-CoA thioesterase/bile acid-CoA:amino acid N-acyltransferase family protein [Geomicrobium sp. JCM 19038]|uniref:acyl-CoA thioesterase/bile acid-CoA:amino acid N-acyltransferase family protein n=1 Tax=Geomicrobium sp. JCM 19038 TaxID=1460635 RepID=UPI00045F18C8|nr:acyl-CoA thioesterase/bile acid-CoA:amino acid N-acyltransferase family protein [Geomicrobium sp. JCM 19038]GAK07976.1 hypothetical protein JCM19038_1735 [Geomicrobium sp. JCM 19038]
MTKPTVTVTPRQSYIDEDVTIIINGCNPGEEVSLYSYVTDDEKEPFMSKATFITNSEGQVLISKVAPISGYYSEVDVNGIFWSMSHETKKHGHYFTKTTAKELMITIKLEIDHEVVDEVLIERYFDKGEVTRTDVNQDGTVGTLYQPIHEGNYQNIILLAGSDGGRLEHSAALLASKGFNVLDLSYFNQSGVPKDLENIPLEYFKNSIELLKKITGNHEKVTLVGYSRGAELALLLASEYDEFNAVVAGAPSAYITSGLRNSIYAPINSWTINGEAKPYLKFRYRPSTMLYFISKWLTKKPYPLKEFGIVASRLRLMKRSE